jgi:multiple sugar transport system permease protein
MLLPLLWLVSSSLKLEQRVFQFPPQWIPDPIRWINYYDALTFKPFHLYLKNTLLIAALNQVAILLLPPFVLMAGPAFWSSFAHCVS